MLKTKMYVRCPADQESMYEPRIFVCGQIINIDEFKRTVSVKVHDPFGHLLFFEDLPKGVIELPLGSVDRCSFFIGSIVVYKGSSYKVLSCQKCKDDYYKYYIQNFDDTSVVKVPEADVIAAFNNGQVDPCVQLKNYEFQNPAWYLGRAVVAKSMDILENSIYGFKELAGSKIYLMPHQVNTIMRCLQESPCRYMLADEVGMGKTIEAISVYKIYTMNQSNKKALIVVPQVLKEQWISELLLKFNIPNGMGKNNNSVTVKTLQELSEKDLFTDWDFVIVDEVHKYLFSQSEYEKLHKISTLAKNILLLSATPVQQKKEEYLDLLRLLLPQKYNSFSVEKFGKLIAKQSKIIQKTALILDDLGDFEEEINSLAESAHDSEECEELFEEIHEDLEEMSNWASLAGFRGSEKKNGEITYSATSFSAKAAINSQLIPPRWDEYLNTAQNQFLMNVQNAYDKSMARKTQDRAIRGTFSRKLAIENDYLHFFAPGDEVFDCIVDNAINSCKGCSSAFATFCRINWIGLIFTWSIAPDTSYLLDNGVSIYAMSPYRNYLFSEQVDVLSNDILRNLKKVDKIGSEKKSVEEIQVLREEKESAIEALTTIDAEIEKMNQKLIKDNDSLEALHQLYTAKGGDAVEKRQETLKKRADLMAELSNVEDRLHELMADALPMLLVEDLVVEIKLQATDEHTDSIMQEAVLQLDNIFEDFAVEYLGDKKAGIDFIEYVKKHTEDNQIETVYGLSEQALFQTNNLVEGVLKNTADETKIIIKKKKKLVKQISEFDSYLMLDINDKELKNIHKKIKAAEQAIIDDQVKIAELEQRRGAANSRVMTATSEFGKYVEAYLSTAELKDSSDRIIKYSNIALNVIEKYRIELQKRKTNILAATITDCYLKLANKKNLIQTIVMDPESLDLRYLSENGAEVPKDSLSAGEQQLMVISILWALALCSKKKLPVIIDTPLSRLDSLHRTALITTYFPNAGEQTIILSTDSEIDAGYYQLMKENIGDEFTLNYDENSKSTSIERGYLIGAKL